MRPEAVAARIAGRVARRPSVVAAVSVAAPTVVAITIDVGRPSPADVTAQEAREDEDFGPKDPRRFNFRRSWSDGDTDVVAVDYIDNWDSIEFRAFVWDNADGRGEELFELTGTRDLVSQFDPAQ